MRSGVSSAKFFHTSEFGMFGLEYQIYINWPWPLRPLRWLLAECTCFGLLLLHKFAYLPDTIIYSWRKHVAFVLSELSAPLFLLSTTLHARWIMFFLFLVNSINQPKPRLAASALHLPVKFTSTMTSIVIDYLSKQTLYAGPATVTWSRGWMKLNISAKT